MSLAALALGAAWSAHGRPAVYRPPGGGPAAVCRVIRAAHPLSYGGVELPVEGLCLDLLVSECVPAAGGVLSLDGGDHAIDIPALRWPAALDPEGLRCRVLLSGWGAAVTWRASEGDGDTLRPPQGGPWRLAADAPSGADVVDLESATGWAVGTLASGDRLTLAGAVHDVTGPIAAVDGVFSGLPIAPALVGAIGAGTVVEIAYGTDLAARAAVRSYAPGQVLEGVRAGDLRVVLPHAALGGVTPAVGHQVRLDGVWLTVVSAVSDRPGGNPVLWDIQARSA